MLKRFYSPVKQKWGEVTRCFSSEKLHISEEVSEALHNGTGVVALESTIITHGMPYPENLRTALSVETIVRQYGSVPATIGILQGKVKVGLSKKELEYLSDPETSSVKTSRRDFPIVLGKKLNGGTTVSGTMVLAHKAGVQMFVTGGIGGVHRGVEDTMDVSADLTELGRTPVVVVSAGVKSILDIGRTLEYLETEGVCVCSYGQSREFPAFFTPNSGFSSPYNLTNPYQAAEVIAHHFELGLQTGMLIGVPPEQSSIGTDIEAAIQKALQESKVVGIVGRDVTPFVLKKVNELSQGKSLQANISLIENNARVGSQISNALSGLLAERKHNQSKVQSAPFELFTAPYSTSKSLYGEASERSKQSGKTDVVVIGGSIVDFYARVRTENFQSNGATYLGNVEQSFGGVGRNVADCLNRLAVNTLFISTIGQDSHTAAFKSYCQHMDLRGVTELNDYKTATYCAILNNQGELLFGIGDMDIHSQITPNYIETFREDIRQSKLVCLDGNVSIEAIKYASHLAQSYNVPVLYEPTDLHKANKPFLTEAKNSIWMATPNLNELRTMYNHFKKDGELSHGHLSTDELTLQKVLDECVSLSSVILAHIPIVLVTIGRHGVVLCQKKPSHSGGLQNQEASQVSVDWFPAYSPREKNGHIVSVSGAGDCMVAAVISGIIQNMDIDSCVKQGLVAAQLSLKSHHAVPPYITRESIQLTDDQERQLAPKEVVKYKL